MAGPFQALIKMHMQNQMPCSSSILTCAKECMVLSGGLKSPRAIE